MATSLDELLKQIEGQREAITGMGKTIAGAPAGFEYEEAIRGRLKPDEELIKNIAASRAKMLAVPAEVRARQKPGWVTPMQTAGLIAAEQEPVRAQWETLMQLRQAKEGRIEDIIGRVTKMIDTDIQKQKTKYDQAVDELKMSIEVRDWLAGQEKEKVEQAQYATEQEEEKRRWEAEFGLKERELAIKGLQAPVIPTPVVPGATITPDQLSPLAKSVYDGTIGLKDITPTQRAQIAPELNAVGWTSAIITENKQTIGVVTIGLNKALELWKKVPRSYKGQVLGRVADWTRARERNADVQAFETQKGIVAQQLAKFIERNRLSDKDREFYMGLMVNLNQANEGVARAGNTQLIEQLKEYVKNQLNPLQAGETADEGTMPSGTIVALSGSDIYSPGFEKVDNSLCPGIGYGEVCAKKK